MKKWFVQLITIILMLLINPNGFCQKWEKEFGIPYRNEVVTGLENFYDKGMLVITWASPDNNNGFIWNIKTDVNGNILWEKYLNNSMNYSLMGTSAVHDQSGNLYVAGIIWMDKSWPFIAKFSPCGEKIWCRILTGSVFPVGGSASDVIINNDNEIILLCNLDTQNQIEEIFLVSFNTDGNMQWLKPYASKINHPLIAHRYCSQLIKHKKDFILSGYCYWPFHDPNHVFLRPFFIGVDTSFNEKWILPFHANDSVFGDANATIPLNDTMYMGVGYRITGSITDNSILMFFDSEGREYHFKQISNSNFGQNCICNDLFTVERINDTLFIGSAYMKYQNNEIYVPNGEFIFDTTGKVHNFHVRPFRTLSFRNFIKTHDNNFLVGTEKPQPNSSWWDIYIYKLNKDLQQVVTDTNQYVYDSLCPYQIQSGEIDMSDCAIITDIENLPTPEQYFERIQTIPIKAYQNPAHDLMKFEFENTEYHQNMQLLCFDLMGNIMHSEPVIKSQKGAAVNISFWPRGMYMAVVFSNGIPVGKCKFVVG